MKQLPVLLLMLAGFVCAQTTVKQPLTAKGANGTFSELERRFAAAVQEKNIQVINELAAEDYELRTPESPTEPIGRDTWISADLPNFDVKDFRITKMAVRVYNDTTAVVSEKYTQTATLNSMDRSGDFWLIDVWTRHDGNWKLSQRFMNPIPKTAADVKPAKH